MRPLILAAIWTAAVVGGCVSARRHSDDPEWQVRHAAIDAAVGRLRDGDATARAELERSAENQPSGSTRDHLWYANRLAAALEAYGDAAGAVALRRRVVERVDADVAAGQPVPIRARVEVVYLWIEACLRTGNACDDAAARVAAADALAASGDRAPTDPLRARLVAAGLRARMHAGEDIREMAAAHADRNADLSAAWCQALWFDVACADGRAGRPKAAARRLQKILVARVDDDLDRGRFVVQRELAAQCIAAGEWESAKWVLIDVVDALSALTPVPVLDRGVARMDLARVHVALQSFDRAAAQLKAACTDLVDRPVGDPLRLEAEQAYAAVLAANGQTADAIARQEAVVATLRDVAGVEAAATRRAELVLERMRAAPK